MLCTRPRITRVVPGGNAWNTVPQAGVISAITPATFALSCRKTLITAMPLKEFDSRCWMLLTVFVVHNRDQLFFCFMRGQQFHAGKVAANLLAPQLYVSMNPLAVTTEVPPLTHDQVLIRAIYAQVPPAARASRRTPPPSADPTRRRHLHCPGRRAGRRPGGRASGWDYRDVLRGLGGILNRTGLTDPAAGGGRLTFPSPGLARP
jgi:hypothetical protein